MERHDTLELIMGEARFVDERELEVALQGGGAQRRVAGSDEARTPVASPHFTVGRRRRSMSSPLRRVSFALALFLPAGALLACGDDENVTEPEPEPQPTIVQEVDVTVPVTTAARRNDLIDNSPWKFESGAFVSDELADVTVDATFRIEQVTYETGDGRTGTFEYTNEDGTIVHGQRVQAAPPAGASAVQDFPIPIDFTVELRVTAQNLTVGDRGPGEISLLAKRESMTYPSDAQQTSVTVTEDDDGFDIQAGGQTIVDDAALDNGDIRIGTTEGGSA